VRAALYESAHIILTKPLKGFTALKSWAMKLARRSGMKKAKVGAGTQARRHHASDAGRWHEPPQCGGGLREADDGTRHDRSVRAGAVKPRATARRNAASGL
jgi:hypothetical protein